ncbi:hypothetical protein PORY_002654 [Pneumocystis oryctolagi]|uniref:Uncharacterized protein n=1 Tax=Pneumocystis oryctolagi TaxID=42067 RepID=A0ACB7CA64_9ASCO|nr:hypothetical protein PORY_002654 [Pneumocystis oryctolagi]
MKKKHRNKVELLENKDNGDSFQNKHVEDKLFDTNMEMILPDEQKRKKELKEELKCSFLEKKMSSKKKKRLEKYIENKIKKEEKAILIKKLSQYNNISCPLYNSRNMKRQGKRKEKPKDDAKEESMFHMLKKMKYSSQHNSEVFGKKDNIHSLSDNLEQTKALDDAPQHISNVSNGVNGACVSFSVMKKKKLKKQNWRELLEHQKQKKFSRLNSTMESEDLPFSSGDEKESVLDDQLSVSDDVQSMFSSDQENIESNDSQEDECSEESSSSDSTDGFVRAKKFNEWAKMQMGVEKKEENLSNIDSLKQNENIRKTFKPANPDRDLSPHEDIPSNPDLKRKTFYVNLNRSKDVVEARSKLPIIAEEQQIMEAIFNNLCVVICGETGSGKTTQIPQFLFEAGFGNNESDTPGIIGITQPRRVAAISMANRVAYELGEDVGNKVAYQVRFDTTVKSSTVIKFMTDGILLHELASDFLLSKYSVIIIDEAHERTINTDILIGILSRVLNLRQTMSMEDGSNVKPLRLIIMSATLRVTDFTDNKKLFNPSPVLIKISSRQYPVSIHFSRKTTHVNYVEKSFEIVSKIHRRLPPGAILVFLTGQDEIKYLCKLLSQAFPVDEKLSQSENQLSVKLPLKKGSLEAEDIELGALDNDDVFLFDKEEENDDVDHVDCYNFNDSIETLKDQPSVLKVVPLYSLLSTEEQLKVFEPVSKETRLCVVATNVAETSLTIPNVRYVVDCGKVKERIYDEVSGVQSFDIQWISKASADQRSGRAGRTGPGHCYRLYSSAFFDRKFSMYSKPEILRMPIEGVVLKMKSMNIDNVLNFPFPTPPEKERLKKAENLLMCLNALDKQNRITNLGKAMSLFPLAPRYSKMLIIGQQHECLPYIIAIVSALSVDDPFMRKNELGSYNINNEKIKKNDYAKEQPTCDFSEDSQLEKKNEYKKLLDAHKQFCGLDDTSDVLKLLCAVCAYAYDGEKDSFCVRNFLRVKTMTEIQKLRHQITDIMKSNFPNSVSEYNMKLNPPSKLQVNAIKQIVAAGFIDQIAIRADLLSGHSKTGFKSKIVHTPYFTLFPTLLEHHNSLEGDDDPAVYIHSSSVIVNNIKDPQLLPKYIIYHSLYRSSNLSKVKMRTLTTIEANEISGLAKSTPLLTYSKPLEYPCPQIIPESQGLKRKCWVIPRLCANNGQANKSWNLPARSIIQKRTAGCRWEIIDE